jgi:tetratricopeptide (TPR) repeat protein
VGEEVRKGAGELFIYESLGKIEIKGKSEPVPVYVVKGRKPVRPQKWERSPFTRKSRYVSRSEEEGRLLAAARTRLSEGGIGVVLVSGPAGSGKSRLVHESIERLKREGGIPLRLVMGEALPSHATPYDLFAQPMERLLSEPTLCERLFSPAEKGLRDQGERLQPVVEYLAGRREADERMRSLEPAALRLEIQLAIRFVLTRLAALAAEEKGPPPIVHLDSLQWADHASLETIDFLMSNPSGQDPLLFVWTFRPEFTPKPEWRSRADTVEMEVRPLSEPECAEIVGSVFQGEALDERQRSILIRRSGGNPFFLEELIQSLIDGGSVVREGERWVLKRPIDESSLPDTVQRVLAGRFDKLDREQKEILMAAAVIGRLFPVSVMEGVGERMGFGREGTRQRVGLLEDAGFVLQLPEEGALGPQYAFRQAMTRDVVYSMILNHNKKILHALAVAVLESLHGDRAEEYASLLFHHASNSGLPEKTVRYGFLALEQMVRTYAAKEGLETVAVLRRVIGEHPGLGESEAMCERLIEAEIRFYDFLGLRCQQAERVEALEAMVRDSPGNDLRARRAALHRATYFSSLGDFRQAKQHALLGIAGIAKSAETERLRMDLFRLLGMTCYSIGEQTEALEHLRKGLLLSEQGKDGNAEGAFFNLMGLVHFKIGRSAEALEYYEKANLLMKRIGDRRGEANTLGNRGLVHWTMGEYSHALESLQRSHDIFREIGFRKGQAVTLGNLGVIFQKFGEYGEALRRYESAVALHREIHDRAGEGHDLVNLGDTYRHLGDFPKAIEFFEAGKILAEEAGSAYLLTENLNCLGIVHRKMGEEDPARLRQAREYTERALALAVSNALVPAEIKATSNLGRICWLSGEKEAGVSHSFRAMKLIELHKAGVEGSEEDAYVNHYTLLSQEGREAEARECLATLVRLIRTRAEKIREEGYRRSFLENVRQNRFVMEEWGRVAG